MPIDCKMIIVFFRPIGYNGETESTNLERNTDAKKEMHKKEKTRLFYAQRGGIGMGSISVYPTGTTRYFPDLAYNGFTLLTGAGTERRLLDMNGCAYPLGEETVRSFFPGKSDEQSFCMFTRWEERKGRCFFWNVARRILRPADGAGPNAGERVCRLLDYCNPGFPAGYPASFEDQPDRDRMFLLFRPEGSSDGEVLLEADRFGTVLWSCSLGKVLSETADRLYEAVHRTGGMSLRLLGENPYTDWESGRYLPEDLLVSSRDHNRIVLISYREKRVYDRIDGETLAKNPEEGIFLPSGVHLIPAGLPGEGNLLLFDSGAPLRVGHTTVGRFYSRILELDLRTKEIIWSFDASDCGEAIPFVSDHFYTGGEAFLQRLPNGNTLLTRSAEGSLFEVTDDKEAVWEYQLPSTGVNFGSKPLCAIRFSYEAVPDRIPSEEEAVLPPDNRMFRLPGAERGDFTRQVTVEGTEAFREVAGFCFPKKSR